MRNLGSDTVTIKRASLVTDPRGNSRHRDWATASSTVINRCIVEPFLSSDKLNFEVTADREFSRAVWRCYLPPGTDVLSTDHVIFDGVEYEVLSEPARWRRFNGQERYVSVILQLRSG